MFASVQARTFFDAWRAFCRGEGSEQPISIDKLLMAEYAVEGLGRRSYDKTIADYFKAGGEPDIKKFVSTFRTFEVVQDIRRTHAEMLYHKLSSDLFVADFSLPSQEFVSKELYNVGYLFYPVADEAIKQCVTYGGRHWQYFKRVAEQLAAVSSARDRAEEMMQESMRIPHSYFEDLKSASSADASSWRKSTAEAIAAAKDDQLMDKNVEKID